MTNKESHLLAERIADLIKSGTGTDGMSELRRAVEDLGRRIEALEDRNTASNLTHAHPSLEKYAVLEAVSGNGTEEKACAFEPNGRPCDHCSLCSSRGF